MGPVLNLLDTLRMKHANKLLNKIGRPKGNKSSSKFDEYQTQIINLLRKGLNISEIARELNIGRSSLSQYIQTREIKKIAYESEQ